jgi:hypothetical protein
MDTTFGVKGEPGQLEIVEDVFISCSRLLLGIVKSQCEGNWKDIHAKMLARLATPS